jgi:hypothetical protein
MVTGPIATEEKRQALERVLASRALGRSEQLRSFLRHICEAEFEGRAQQLNEYALGVSVLGRPANYSPAEDSCVRSRAYELRNKLRSYYQAEAPADPIQIEIDKGAYVPRFSRRAEAAEPTPTSTVGSGAVKVEPPSQAPAPLARRVPTPLSVVALAVAAALAAISLYAWRAAREIPAAKPRPNALATREVQALWKPFLDSPAPLIMSFEIRLFLYAPPTGLVVRDFQTNQVAEVSLSKPLQTFKERMGASELRETFDYADFGAVHAVFLLGRLLGREVALKHSSSLGWEDIWNSNIIFIGKPNLHPSVRHALKDTNFTSTELGDIVNQHPSAGEPVIYRNAATHGAGQKYALITVMPGPQPGRRMMILSGGGAELMWALAECVTDPSLVHDIFSGIILPSNETPAAFQVVIQADFESNVPVKIRHVTHRVSQP